MPKTLNARLKDTVAAGVEPPYTTSATDKLHGGQGLAAFVTAFITAVRQHKIEDREELLKPPR